MKPFKPGCKHHWCEYCENCSKTSQYLFWGVFGALFPLAWVAALALVAFR